MLEVQPTSFCPVDSRAGTTPGQTDTGIDAGAISTSLREASFVSRPWVAREIVAGMDDAQLAALARQDGGRDALQALDDALADAPWLMPDAPAQRDRIATALREDDQPDGTTTGTGGVTTTTEHIGENTVTWTNDSEGRPIRAEADLSEVFSGLDRSAAETRAQREAGDRGVDGDHGGHIIGHRFVKDQGLKNMFPQDGNFNVSAYKKLENEWADWIDVGMDVHITVELAPKQVDRPEQVRVAYEVTDPDDGRVVYDQRVTFRNEAGQQFDRVPRADMANA
ncbi:DNA/RNA non-specific endonuclease [Luteimonas soli]|uniref:DNA/RNA non-specific endonuclease n=1 Tax=Luteimonas soli TaxID=1648966 RepID=A0ABV7XP77_9GAMM